MTEVMISLLGYTFKAIVFAGIAYAGIILGKKFRDSKDAGRAVEGQESK
ncbi:MAG: hypothetical protein HFG56_05180 [Lachnospiraceae bacterium]|nr:hypothetical protein [Lachnospiraceae bacterium]